MTALVVFAILTIAFVIWSTGLSWSLESETYYQDGIEYQDQINRMERASELRDKIVVEQINNAIEISFREIFVDENIEGFVTLFRPSDHSLDRTYRLSLDAEWKFRIPSGDIPVKGLWRIKIAWKTEGKKYFIQKNIFLN